MSTFYFEALPKERAASLTAEQNLRIAKAQMARTYEALGPFYKYLSTAIKTAENKQAIKAEWRSIDHADLLALVPITKIYWQEKFTRIRLLYNAAGTYRIVGARLEGPDLEWDEPLRVLDGGQKLKLPLAPTHLIAPDLLQHPELPPKTVKAAWGFFNFYLEPTWVVVEPRMQLELDGNPVLITSVEGDELVINGLVQSKSQLSFHNSLLAFEILDDSSLPTTKVIRESNAAWYLLSETTLPKAQEISHNKYLTFFDRTQLRLESDGKPLEGTADDIPLGIRIPGAARLVDRTVTSPEGIRFRLERSKQNARTRNWIQLVEPEDTQEDQPGLSPLRHFFDDEIEIIDEADNTYQIVEGIESERKLLLRRKNQPKHETCLPQGKILHIKVNTHQLKMQVNAVRALQSKPVKEQHKLIQLLEDRKRVQWPSPSALPKAPEWQVLTDSTRDGALEQRYFVRQALETTDFAILEGPPGSGKTTVILELICQLIQRGKRVLLCGSTHVAIDNVLERLKAKGLLHQNGILPIRIGDEHRISDSVKEFQIERFRESVGMPEPLLLEAANLVCGTTIGILQHPTLKQNRSREEQAAPILPSFDYLIIDECSKTTFQEFLVPAMFARHWILVGDVQQLSPFTDREQLSTNIAHLELKDKKTLPLAHQAACFYLFQMAKVMEKAENFWPIIVVNQEVANAMALELAASLDHKGLQGKVIAFVSQQSMSARQHDRYLLLMLTPTSDSLIAAAAADFMIITEKAYSIVQDQLPIGNTVLLRPEWLTSSHALRSAAWAKKAGQPAVSLDKASSSGHVAIAEHLQKELVERSWAEEIAWRIDRAHQLRMKTKERQNSYRETIQAFLPRAFDQQSDLLNRIDTIGQVALPSILEMLERGLPHTQHTTASTLSQGFYPQEKASRHTRLSYQQRMHPEISRFPRKRFYQGEALLDMDSPDIREYRAWAYQRYTSRSTWLHVQGNTHKNYNLDEVHAMEKELLAFLEFAKKTPPPPNGRDNPNVWEVACLTFYRGQEARLRERLRAISHNSDAFSKFTFAGKEKVEVQVQLHTVDKFQGQEADIVFLSMVQTRRDGFLDSPNRLNVALTRARFQLVIVGDHNYYATRSRSEELRALADHHLSSKLNHPPR